MATHTYKDTQILQESAKNLFDLVMAIESYPQFLPWCTHAVITKRLDDQNLEAVLGVGYGPFSESFTSHVTYGNDSSNFWVESRSIKGPLKHLNSRWIFQPLTEQSCELSYEVSFEVQGGLLSMVLENVFHHITQTMVNAFKEKALQG